MTSYACACCRHEMRNHEPQRWVCDDAGSQAPEHLRLCPACHPRIDGKVVRIDSYSLVNVLVRIGKDMDTGPGFGVLVYDRYRDKLYAPPWLAAVASARTYPIDFGIDPKVVIPQLLDNQPAKDALEVVWRMGASALDLLQVLGQFDIGTCQ